MATKRILQIIPTLERSGAEKQLALLAAGLPKSDFETHVCALTRGGPLENDLRTANVPVTILDKRWKADPAAYWRLKRFIQDLKPDLVHTWMFAANSYGRSAALQAKVPHIVGGERCVDVWKADYELAIDRWLARRSERIVVNSSGVSEFYVGRGIPAEKFVVIPNGVGLAEPATTSREAILAELGLPPNSRLIGCVGRLWPQKRMKDVIWAADLLKVVRDDAHLLIIGDGPERDRLVRFREQVRIEDKVHFLGHRADVPGLLPHFDLLWLASGYEGLPNVVLEAMAAGIPVVATDIPGNRDLVIENVTGFLVPVGDRAAIAQRANKILDDDALRHRLGTAGQERARAEFTIERMIERHANLYRELLG